MNQNQNRQQQDLLIVFVAILAAVVIFLLFHAWSPPPESRPGLFFNNFLPSAMVSVISVPVVYILFSRHGIKLVNSIDENYIAEAVVSRLQQNSGKPATDMSSDQLKPHCENTNQLLVGLWVETFRDSGDGNFAIGAFWWNAQSLKYHYEGTRFDPKGRPVYHWRSRLLFCDDKHRAIIYSYEHYYLNGYRNDGKVGDFGLGQLEYEVGPTPGSTRFMRGLFSDRDKPCSVNLDIQRLSDLDKGLSSSAFDDESRITLGPHIARILKDKRGSGPNN